MEKLNLDSDSPSRAEVRREWSTEDVAPLVGPGDTGCVGGCGGAGGGGGSRVAAQTQASCCAAGKPKPAETQRPASITSGRIKEGGG